MAIVKILTQEDPALSKICHPVTKLMSVFGDCLRICATL